MLSNAPIIPNVVPEIPIIGPKTAIVPPIISVFLRPSFIFQNSGNSYNSVEHGLGVSASIRR